MIFKVEGSAKGKEWFSCRDVLWYLVFCGFAISYMLRLNLSLAIVAMAMPRPSAAAVAQCTQHAQPISNLSTLWLNQPPVTDMKEHNFTHSSIVPSKDDTTRPEKIEPVIPVQLVDRFAWTEYEQGLVLGGYFWIHWATQVPGALLARHYGTKFMFGWANLATALLGFLIPFCARYHLYAFVVLRVLQGAIAGVIWPSMHDMTAKWIPPNERSKFISSYQGSSVGAALTYPFCAMLINWLGWASVFYVTSALGVLWYVAWYYLAFNTPQEHPRISEVEKTYILENLSDSVSHANSRSVPWKAILTSGPLWVTALVSLGGNWGLLTLMSEAPSYFNYIHGWNLSAIGWLSAAPHVIRMMFSYCFSSFADWLLGTKKMSTTNLRKFAMFVCNGFQGVMLLGLAYSGCHPTLAIVFMIAGISASGALSAGALASCIDLSPNFASVILGLSNIIVLPTGFISPLIVGFLTNDNQTIEQWRLVFLIAVAIMFVTGILYMFVGTSDTQPWNDAVNQVKWQELQKLRSNVGDVEYQKITEAIGRRENGYNSPVKGGRNRVAEFTTNYSD